jgi:hypothetical protein
MMQIICKKAGKNYPEGVPVTLQVRLADDMISPEFTFTKSIISWLSNPMSAHTPIHTARHRIWERPAL